jgi:hypothetical protein
LKDIRINVTGTGYKRVGLYWKGPLSGYCEEDNSPSRYTGGEFLYCLRDCDRLCGLVVRVSGYRSRGPGFDSRSFHIFWEEAGLERGPLSLMRKTEDLLEGKVAAQVWKTEINDRGNPLRWPRDTLYPQKLAQLRQQAAVARSVKFARGPKAQSF